MGSAGHRKDDARAKSSRSTTGAHFERISAVSAGVADLRRIVAEAQARRRAGLRTVLFIDEIHRFNKAQQDAVLPYVEDGTITLDRRDDREPVVRSELRAAVARARLRA